MSRGNVAISSPPALIIDKMSDASITVTASASYERAERLSHAMRDHFRVVNGGDDGAEERDSAQDGK